MKKKTKYGIIAAVVLLAVTVFVLIPGSPVQKKFRKWHGPQAIMVQGLLATWEYIERDIDLEYFYQLDHTATYKQIVKEIGKQNGARGSGIIAPYWEIDYNLFAVMWFSLNEDGEYDRLYAVQICDSEKTLENVDLYHGEMKKIWGIDGSQVWGLDGPHQRQKYSVPEHIQ